MNMIVKPPCVTMAVPALAAGAGAQTFTVLKTFNPNINLNGLHARGTLVQGPDGTLYGIATDGGAGAAGLVFRIQTNGTGYTVIKNFPLTDVTTGTNSDGANPMAGLVLSSNMLYGTTRAGGLSGHGTVFSLALSSVVPIPLNIRGISNAVVLSWTDPASAFSLQASTLVTGVYTNVPGATSPFTNTFSDATKFFRLLAN